MNLSKIPARSIAQRIWSFPGEDPEEIRYAATVSIWLRWFFFAGSFIESSYRVEYWSLSHILNSVYLLGIMAPNTYVLWKMRGGKVDMRMLLALSAVDVAALSFSVSLSGGFDSRYFGMYYIAVALFAWVFTSTHLVFLWTMMLATIYMLLCLTVGDGIAFDQHEEKELFYRLFTLFAVAVSVNLITRFERTRRLAAAAREQELNRQRIEMSQTIHDTTAQSAYTLGLGLEEAIEMADADPELVRKLEAMWELSRSTMWELRHPIDGGPLFSDGRLSEVLKDHADTFTTITSIPAKLVLHGTEPQLSAITRSLLFSIAHNALTNALRHSGADTVTITLDFGSDGLRMTVLDDGSGLPDDYATHGYGFRNMRIDAERMSGRLEVESNGGGTTVSCSVAYESVLYEQNLGDS